METFVYQLVLKGNYAFSSSPAIFEDKTLFTSKEKITDEYVQSVKEKLLSAENDPLRYWKEKDYVSGRHEPIEAFIRTYALK